MSAEFTAHGLAAIAAGLRWKEASSVPEVRLGPPLVAVAPCGPSVELLDALALSCSACGDLVDVDGTGRRSELARLAHRHAEQEHDGQVDRVGWV